MSLDEMEAGPEMDRIIAEVVMKWTRSQWGTDPETYGAPIYEWRDASGHRAWATAWFNNVAWSPSTSIAHAWDVVDLLRKQGVGITVRTPGVYASADFGPTDKFSVLMQGRYPAGWFRHGAAPTPGTKKSAIPKLTLQPQVLQDAVNKALRELEAIGYKNNAHVGRTEWTRQTIGEYIVGQAINCLRHGLPPHQVTRKFAEDFAKREATP